jgi:two-component system sensor histidine kinase PilS (NtrC family)
MKSVPAATSEVTILGGSRGPSEDPGSFLILSESVILVLAAVLTVGLDAAGVLVSPGPTPLVWSILVLWFGFLILGSLLLRGTAHAPRRLVGDLTFCLSLVVLSGGVDSYLLPILLACVALASSQLGRARALTLAAGSCGVLLLVTLGRQQGWVGPELLLAAGHAEGVSGDSWLKLLTLGTAILAVGLLGVRLGDGLREARRINELIARSIGEGVVILDDAGRFVHVNPTALDMLGFPEDQPWQGRPVRGLLRREDDDELRTVLEEPRSGERKVVCRVGRSQELPVWLSARRSAPEHASGGYWVFRLRDRTLEERASRAEARLQHLEELEDLALGLAHEIRNPLASIRGGVQELGSGRLGPEQVERLTGIILRESDRLDRTVSQVMEYSRVRAEPRVMRVDLLGVLDEVIEVLGQRADARGVALVREVGDGVDAVIEGSRDQLTKVFLNLGINALEAGAGRVRFRLTAESGGGLDLVVEDDGSGMDEETRARAFNPFYTTKTREGGLGLALVRKIVEGHEGSIEIESERGGGTRFRLWFPAWTAEPKESPTGDADGSEVEVHDESPRTVGATE